MNFQEIDRMRMAGNPMSTYNMLHYGAPKSLGYYEAQLRGQNPYRSLENQQRQAISSINQNYGLQRDNAKFDHKQNMRGMNLSETQSHNDAVKRALAGGMGGSGVMGYRTDQVAEQFAPHRSMAEDRFGQLMKTLSTQKNNQLSQVKGSFQDQRAGIDSALKSQAMGMMQADTDRYNQFISSLWDGNTLRYDGGGGSRFSVTDHSLWDNPRDMDELELAKFHWQRAMDEAKLTGMYQGVPLWDRQLSESMQQQGPQGPSEMFSNLISNVLLQLGKNPSDADLDNALATVSFYQLAGILTDEEAIKAKDAIGSLRKVKSPNLRATTPMNYQQNSIPSGKPTWPIDPPFNQFLRMLGGGGA